MRQILIQSHKMAQGHTQTLSIFSSQSCVNFICISLGTPLVWVEDPKLKSHIYPQLFISVLHSFGLSLNFSTNQHILTCFHFLLANNNAKVRDVSTMFPFNPFKFVYSGMARFHPYMFYRYIIGFIMIYRLLMVRDCH